MSAFPSRLLLERFHAVSLAGMLSESGLFEYVRNAFFEVTEALPTCCTLKHALQGVLVKLDGCTVLGGSCEQVHWLIAELRAFEASRAGRKAWRSFWRVRPFFSWAPPPRVKRVQLVEWLPFSLTRSGDSASEDSAPPTPSSPRADPPEVFTIYIERDLPSFLRRRGEFDDEFVHSEGVPGQPSPLDACHFGPYATRCFLKRLRDIARALGKPDLAARLPVYGEDVISSGLLCPGCCDRSPQKGWWVHKRYRDHAPLRASHPHLERETGPGVRFYHSIASCPFLWKRVHQFVKANPHRMELFDYSRGDRPPTRCVACDPPASSSA